MRGANPRSYNDQKNFDIGCDQMHCFAPLLLQHKWLQFQIPPPSSKDIEKQQPVLHLYSWQVAQNGSTWKTYLWAATWSTRHGFHAAITFQILNHKQPVFAIRWHSNFSNPGILSAAHPVRAFIVSYYSLPPMWSCSCGCGSFGCRSWSTSLQIFSKMDCFFPSHLSSLADKISWSRSATSL